MYLDIFLMCVYLSFFSSLSLYTQVTIIYIYIFNMTYNIIHIISYTHHVFDLLGIFLIPEQFFDPLPCVYDHIVSNINKYIYI